MNYPKAFFFLLSVACAHISLYSSDTSPSQEITIQLPTEKPLSSIYLSSIDQTDSSFPKAYLKQLENILEYDFNHNGKTVSLAKSAASEKQLQSGYSGAIQSPYAIYFSIKEKKIQCKVYNLLQEHSNLFPEIALSGSLNEDRVLLHKLSDAIHKLLFQTDGVASSKILFSFQKKTGTDSWVSEITECDFDGANLRTITKENSYCVTPVNIPKGKGMTKNLFLYVSYKEGQPKIFIASKEQGSGKRVLDIRGNQLLPAISKQKDQLAFICDASGRTDLFIQPLEPETGKTGTPVQLFSYPRSTQASPTFSPDGKQIAFVSDKDGPARIYLIPTRATNKRPIAKMLTKKNRENTCPCWSSDGTKLAYSAKTKGVRQIWIYDFLTGEERQLTSGPGDKENPCFAENNLHIVFNSTDKTNSDLYIVNLNQPDAIKITTGPGKKHYPVWSSR
jgi:TolB protein